MTSAACTSQTDGIRPKSAEHFT